MGKFFERLKREKKLDEFVKVLDWIFNDLKFSDGRNWNRGYIGQFTKEIRKLQYLSDKDGRVLHGKIKKTDFPNQRRNQGKERKPFIMMTCHESFARDLIRHIRNGIAHGEATISNNSSELYLEIIDYTQKTKTPEKQSAYIFLPLQYIIEFYNIYERINKSIMNTKSKDRKQTKNKKGSR